MKHLHPTLTKSNPMKRKILIASIFTPFLSGCGGGGGGVVVSPPEIEEVIPLVYSMTSNSTQMDAEIWKQSYTGAGVSVAVLDTGLRESGTTNPYNIGLVENLRHGIDGGGNLISLGDISTSTGNHGDDMAQIIGSEDYGMAVDATIHHGVIADSGFTTTPSMVKGIEWALNNSSDIINLSFSYGGVMAPYNSTPNASLLPYEIEYKNIKNQLILQDAVLVNSAGNDGTSTSDEVIVTASFADIVKTEAKQQVLIVGASYNNEELASFSNYAGSDTDVQDRFIVAPAASNTADGFSIGTSGAAANISGALALMKERWTTLGGRELSQILLDTADRTFLSYDVTLHGQGMVDMFAAFSPIGMASIPYNGESLSPTAITMSLPTGFSEASISTAVLDSYHRDFTLQYTVPSKPYTSPVHEMTSFFTNDSPSKSFSYALTRNSNLSLSSPQPYSSLSGTGSIPLMGLQTITDKELSDTSLSYINYSYQEKGVTAGVRVSLPKALLQTNHIPGKVGAESFIRWNSLEASVFSSTESDSASFYGSDDRQVLGASIQMASNGFSAGIGSYQENTNGSSIIQNYGIHTNRFHLRYNKSLLNEKFKMAIAAYHEMSHARIDVTTPMSVGDGSLVTQNQTLRSQREINGVSATLATDSLQFSVLKNNLDTSLFFGVRKSL